MRRAPRRVRCAKTPIERATVHRALLVVLLGAVACAPAPATTADPQAEIEAMLTHSAAAWNRGDLAGFMGDYVHDSMVTYRSGAHFLHGWQPLFDRYQANYFAPGKQRDSLTFGEVQVRSLAPDLALAMARFALHRGDSLTASGPFTLVLRRQEGRWQILHDHTSADTKP